MGPTLTSPTYFHLDATLMTACHDELVVECPEEQAEEVARFLEKVMIAGMDADHPERP